MPLLKSEKKHIFTHGAPAWWSKITDWNACLAALNELVNITRLHVQQSRRYDFVVNLNWKFRYFPEKLQCLWFTCIIIRPLLAGRSLCRNKPDRSTLCRHYHHSGPKPYRPYPVSEENYYKYSTANCILEHCSAKQLFPNTLFSRYLEHWYLVVLPNIRKYNLDTMPSFSLYFNTCFYKLLVSESKFFGTRIFTLGYE